MEIAFAIAEARHKAKLTQQELAEKVGTTQPVVARWECGKVLPSTRSLQKVATATGTRLHVELLHA